MSNSDSTSLLTQCLEVFVCVILDYWKFLIHDYRFLLFFRYAPVVSVEQIPATSLMLRCFVWFEPPDRNFFAIANLFPVRYYHRIMALSSDCLPQVKDRIDQFRSIPSRSRSCMTGGLYVFSSLNPTRKTLINVLQIACAYYKHFDLNWLFLNPSIAGRFG